MSRIRSSKGFTVIELLVVLSIICVLVSMLLPSVNSAIRNSREIVCTSNERVLVGSMIAYAGANNGYLPGPQSVFAMDSVGVADFSVGSLWPYVGGTPQSRALLMHCPADAFEQLPTYGGTDYFCFRNFTYSCNISVAPYRWTTGDWVDTMTLGQVAHPDQHAWLYEEFAPNDQENWGPTDDDDWLTGRHGPAGSIEHRASYNNDDWKASGRGNVGYFDGHVGLMSVQGYFQAPYYHFGPLNQ